MGTGLLTLAVVTAQVASSFVAQGSSRTKPAPQDEAAPGEVTLAELDQRLARIEQLLTAAHPGDARALPEAIDSNDDRKSKLIIAALCGTPSGPQCGHWSRLITS